MKKPLIAIAFVLLLFFPLVNPSAIVAMEKPSRQEIMRYEQDSTYKQRLNNPNEIGNHRVDPYLVWRLNRNLESLVLKAQGKSDAEIEKKLTINSLPTTWTGLPTTGTPKVLTMLVDFPDYPHSTSQTITDFNSKFFGSGDSSQYPYESVRNYYQRSSYNQLTITGNALGWYRAKHNRSYYSDLEDGYGQDVLIKEVLNYYNSQGHDFGQYDNNNDGTIDGIYIKWTGPDNGWEGFWWAYQWAVNDSSYTIDGKHLGKYVWSWYSSTDEGYTGPYIPRTDIHETGHLLGLPDYYDYDETVGPDGGVGGLDMMDDNWGDHNAFSKLLLNWITPTIISSGTQLKTFNPSGTSKDVAIIMPSVTGTLFGEYFITQYRKRSDGNDPSNYPIDGMLLWHVDATLNSSGTDCMYDNSYTTHKLLALEQADGLGEIEKGNGVADAGDYYISPKTFGSGTKPNSNSYSGTSTNVVVDSLTANGATMSARVGIDSSVPVTSVLLNFTELSVPAGAFETLIETVQPKNASNMTVSWESNNPDVAKISNHQLSAINPGVAIITVKTQDGQKTAQCVVTVYKAEKKEIPVNLLTWDQKKANKEKSWTVNFNGEIEPVSANSNNIYVTDENDYIFPTNISVVGRTLFISPVYKYNVSKRYYINLTSGLKSKDGIPIIKPVRMPFLVE